MLGTGLPPIDTSKPNQHSNKAEFSVEFEAVNNSLNLITELIEVLTGASGDNAQEEMLIRLGRIIQEKLVRLAPREKVESPVELVRRNVADVGGFTASLFVLLDLMTVLRERHAELKDQEEQFWNVSHRPPDYFARAIALRLARLYSQETGERPTIGTSGETGDPSTGYTWALREIFDLLGIATKVRSPAEWAVEQLREADLRPSLYRSQTVESARTESPSRRETIRKIADAIKKGAGD